MEIAEDFQRRYLVNARKALRWAHGWSQDEVAAAWCRRWPDEPRTGQNISTWERWPVSGHEPSVGTLVRLAELYECDVADLVGDLGCFRHLDDATARGEAAALLATNRRGLAPVVPLNREAGHMETSRRMFAAGAVAAAIGLAEPFRGLLTRPISARPVIGPDHVTALEGAIEQIEVQDATVGGGQLIDAVDRLHEQVAAWLQGRSFATPAVGEALQHLRGDLLQWSGWLAFDGDQIPKARRLTEETLVHARLIDDPVLEVQALNCMCQLLIADDRPNDSLHASEAALRIGAGWATPRVQALFHLRAARANAGLGDRLAFSRAMVQARSHLEQGPHHDDPLFVHFVTPHELASIEGLSYLALDRADRAITAFSEAVAEPDPARRRNVAYYATWLAAAHARHNDLAGASEAGLAALPLVADLAPGRTTSLLGALRTHVQPHRRAASVVDDFANRYDAVLAR